jgi:hypothetical protein
MRMFTKKESKWIERLQRTLDGQPETITGFCTGTSIDFYADELKIENYGVVSNKYNTSVKNKNWECGAY